MEFLLDISMRNKFKITYKAWILYKQTWKKMNLTSFYSEIVDYDTELI